MRLRWENVPIPPQYVVALLLAGLLEVLIPIPALTRAAVLRVIGWFLILSGIGLAAWSVSAAGEVKIERPDVLIKSGPYSFSRNPMYLAWGLFYAGIGLVANSLLILALLPALLCYTHFIDILPEERKLARQFGDDYLDYKRSVRRYF